MADTSGLITGLDAIGTIDRTADLLEIVDVSANTSFKVTVNNLVGISGGNVVSTSDSQTISNKTLGNSNIITVLDGNFTLQDNVDNTKQAQFQLSGNTTGTTRTYSLPDATGTLMDLTSTQTATNKTLTSPVVNGGTLTNVSVSANTITGFTTSNTGNIYGIAVTTGQISGAVLSSASVGSTALANNAVQASQLATNAITLGYAQITTNFPLTSAQTTPTQVTGLTATVTIPSGGRRIRITGFVGAVTLAGGLGVLTIWDGTVNSGTQLNQSNVNTSGSYGTVYAVVSPSAGSKTYNIGIANSGANNTTVGAATTQPAFILVEAI